MITSMDEFDLRRSGLEYRGQNMFKEHRPAARTTLAGARYVVMIASSSFGHLNARLAKEVCAWLPDSVLTLAGRFFTGVSDRRLHVKVGGERFPSCSRVQGIRQRRRELH